MRAVEVASKFNIDSRKFEEFLSVMELPREVNKFLGSSIEDDRVEDYVNLYRLYEARGKRYFQGKKGEDLMPFLLIKQEDDKEEDERQKRINNMLITSGFSFDGYKVVKYSGYISGDDACELANNGLFDRAYGERLTAALVKIRRNALAELKEAAADLGCNAVIGVDFDYLTMNNNPANPTRGIVCVTANGNAVIIEKEE